MRLVTLQDIFPLGYPEYECPHPLPAHVRKAARAIMHGRTAVLGGHVHACPDGHIRRIWSNSCRHRSCPQCAFIQVERWLATPRARLLACDHDHVIFPMPHDLNPLWLGNTPLLTTLVLQTVRETLLTVLADPQDLGAQPGIIAALHTWGQTLVLHPPIHCLVTGGGVTADGQWKAVRNGLLLPVRVAMALFRCRPSNPHNPKDRLPGTTSVLGYPTQDCSDPLRSLQSLLVRWWPFAALHAMVRSRLR